MHSVIKQSENESAVSFSVHFSSHFLSPPWNEGAKHTLLLQSEITNL